MLWRTPTPATTSEKHWRPTAPTADSCAKPTRSRGPNGRSLQTIEGECDHFSVARRELNPRELRHLEVVTNGLLGVVTKVAYRIGGVDPSVRAPFSQLGRRIRLTKQPPPPQARDARLQDLQDMALTSRALPNNRAGTPSGSHGFGATNRCREWPATLSAFNHSHGSQNWPRDTQPCRDLGRLETGEYQRV